MRTRAQDSKQRGVQLAPANPHPDSECLLVLELWGEGGAPKFT